MPNGIRNRISRARARRIALNRVGGGRVVDVDLDRYMGYLVYEVTIYYGRYEYEVYINARNGRIMRVRRERRD